MKTLEELLEEGKTRWPDFLSFERVLPEDERKLLEEFLKSQNEITAMVANGPPDSCIHGEDCDPIMHSEDDKWNDLE